MITVFGLRIDLDWFHNHADRELIQRWTVKNTDRPCRHELVFEGTPQPAPQAAPEWCFLVLGDTGDSDRFGPRLSPQGAVAAFLAQDCALEAPPSVAPPGAALHGALPGAPAVTPPACMVLHTGDVNYLTGEQRLYDLNFIDPYRAFQTEESHYANLTFRIPFLPVPGNHDYYDLHGWVAQIMKVGSWVGLSELLTHFFYRLGLSVPLGGSDMGAAYMGAFVEMEADCAQPLAYRPGVHTKLPNRYYQFRKDNVHFFALDSNTLDAPPPGDEDPFKERASALVERSERKLGRLNEQVKRDRDWEQQEVARQREAMRAGEREELWPRLQQLLGEVADCAQALALATERWADKIANEMPDAASQLKALSQETRDLHDRWRQVLSEAGATSQPVAAYEARLDDLIKLQEAWLHHLAKRDEFTVTLPGAPEYEAARQARLALDGALGRWCRERVGESMPGPCVELAEEEDSQEEQHEADLGEAILDTQRDLALARKLNERSAEDYDTDQIEWLRAGLAAVKDEEATRQQSDPAFRLWRIVYMHHPLYTTLPSHAERSDSVGVRHNLEEILRDADLVIAGHSHGFEWLHSQAAPHQCYLVCGGGGQNRLQGSIFSPAHVERYQAAIESLTNAGLDSLVWASGDTVFGSSSVENKIFSYVRIRVLPDELRIEPVGVRQLSEDADGADANGADTDGAIGDHWERVYPLPVHEVPDAAAWRGDGARPTEARVLDHIKIRRGARPEAVWA